MARLGQAPNPAGTHVVCDRCHRSADPDVRQWRCRCGGLWDLALAPFDPRAMAARARAPWRYPGMLPLPLADCTLGEGGTPIVAAEWLGRNVLAKLEFLQPTGCHKDRGSAVLAAALRAASVGSAVEDSSGNAGASLAAYAARAGVQLRLFVPRCTPTAKLRQAAAYGAHIDRSAIDREAAACLASQAITAEQPYASHVFSPFFLAGQASLAVELWEDLDRHAPDTVVMPLGNGILLYGLYLGFRALLDGGCIAELPQLVGIQAAACAPLAAAFASAAEDAVPVPIRATRALGVRVARPPRAAAVLAAVRRTGGRIVAVGERAISEAARLAAQQGWYVEPSAATALAGVALVGPERVLPGRVVVILTGSGLKA